MDTLKSELSTLNGCIVDLESKIGGTIELVKASVKISDSQDPPIIPVQTQVLRFPEITIYEHIDYGGANARTNLNWYYVGGFWNDKISSMVISSGVWQFFQHAHYQGAYWVLGPGYYRWVEAANIPNDIISSFKCIQLTQ
ncbi:beta/gamma crystallin-related protein [Pelosinus baikalensis]|uniref:Beta/gamma crystallin family protein n=1 Tax=Pelosinus baikalensis TaxID=2892015 RepID=A0ABS8HQW7_9FIRM|nr:beta/gamma crystallin-related protein [Pelosinus baikalensis]MCC5465559.1 beta/gamma crystallin family protein [Pelosinus baikalensis]